MPDRLKDMLRQIRPFLLPLLLAVTSFAVYGRILGHGFLSNWDDNRYILENADVHGFSLEHLKAIFSKYYVGNYAPVHLLSYMFDLAFWGPNPGAFLLSNLLLHTAIGLLLYRLFCRFVEDRTAAWFGAALFLFHPVQVETVAWISQRKNLLAMLFFLLAWEFYLRYRERVPGRGRLYYAASLAALLLGLLSKSVAVIFPFAMLLFDHCYLPVIGRPRYLDKVPFVLVSATVAVLAILSQTPDYSVWGGGGGRAGYIDGSPLITFLTMLPVLCSYLRILLWPVGLSALYDPQVHKDIDLTVAAAFLLLALLGFMLFRLLRADRRIAFWPLFALLALLPVSQIVPLVTLMNDRYLYFPMVGIAALAAFGYRSLARRLPGYRRPLAGVCVALLAVYGILSWQRSAVWSDAITLWSDAVVKSPNSSVVWEALGESKHYTANPRRQEAITAYRHALELYPDGDVSRYNLGVAYTELNDYDNADRILRELLHRSPENVMGWAAFGDLALRRLDYREAEKRYKRAIELQPEAVQVHRKIGNLMVVDGRLDEARDAFLRIEALQGGSDPLNAYELARVAALAGDTSVTLAWLEKALQRGYNDFDGMLADEELLPVMADGRFSDLVQRYFPGRR